MKRLLPSVFLAAAVFAAGAPGAHAQLIDFDDLPRTGGAPLPEVYQGLYWLNFQYLTGDTLPDSGFERGAFTRPNVAYNGYGQPALFLADAPFDLTSLFLTAAWNDGLSVELFGYRDGAQIYDRGLTVDTHKRSFVFLDWYGVDAVYLVTSGGHRAPDALGVGTHVALDNLVLNANYPVPEPAAWTWSGILLLGIGAALRRRSRRSMTNRR